MKSELIKNTQTLLTEADSQMLTLKSHASSLMARISELPKNSLDRVNLQTRLNTTQVAISNLKPTLQDLRDRLKQEHAEAKEARKAESSRRVVIYTIHHAEKGYRYFAAESSPCEVILALLEEAPGWFVISVSHIDPELAEEVPAALFEMPE